MSSLWCAKGHRKLVGFIGGLLVAYGISAFYGAAYSAGGSLPATFEWPMGRADQLIQVSDGRRIAVHPASARIQVYVTIGSFFMHGLCMPVAETLERDCYQITS